MLPTPVVNDRVSVFSDEVFNRVNSATMNALAADALPVAARSRTGAVARECRFEVDFRAD